MKLGNDIADDYTSFTFKIPKFKLNFILLFLNLIILGMLIGSLISTTNLHIELSRIHNRISTGIEVDHWRYERSIKENWCYNNRFTKNVTITRFIE